MRTLVWKIFVSFWIVQALFFSMVAILYGTFRGQPPGLYAATGIVAFCERNAVQTYERSGSAALDAYLSDLQLSSGIQMFIVDFLSLIHIYCGASRRIYAQGAQVVAADVYKRQPPLAARSSDSHPLRGKSKQVRLQIGLKQPASRPRSLL